MTKFPGQTSQFQAFLQLTDGIGSYRVTIEVHDLAEDEVLARAEIAVVEFPDRATKLNLIIPVPHLPLRHAGEYDFVVLADGKEIDRQQFRAGAPGVPNDEDEPAEEGGES